MAEAQGGGPGASCPTSARVRSAPPRRLNSYDDITSYNNFYEFGTDKDDPKPNSKNFKPTPWTIAVEGDVAKPAKYALEDFIKPSVLEERIYRLRCVEAWSMVIPWVGIPLADVIKRVEPTGKAKYVEFKTLLDPARMPGQRSRVLDWPYVEGLRLDEAMHPLTILAVGLYGEVLPNQNGAPIRLVVPWKYGFKSIKSIVKMRFMEKQPVNTWRADAAAASTASTRTSIRRSITRAGARRASAASATSLPNRRRRCSTATPSRSPASTPGWTCARTIEADRRSSSRSSSPRRCLPAAALVYGFFTSNLTANPGDYITDQTGTWTLAFLVISLTITPLRRLTGWNAIIRLRRMLGLFSFFYAVAAPAHVGGASSTCFDVTAMIEDVAKRPYITVGMATFVILLALAITSNAWAIRKLGRTLADAASPGLPRGHRRRSCTSGGW